MLRILVVEDNPEKLRRVCECLTSNSNVTLDNLEYCSDLAQAKRRLMEHKFDLLIIDIAIPERPDREASKDGGIMLLEEVSERDCYLVPDHIVGLTAYDSLQEVANKIFEKRNWSVIRYLPESEEWEAQLQNKIEHILSAQRSEIEAEANYESDLAIVCALDDPELSSVRMLNWSWEATTPAKDHVNVIRGEYDRNAKKRLVYAAAAPRMGMTASAVLATKLAFAFRPRYMAMVGIAAGIRGRVNLGDVVVVDTSFDYGSGKLAEADGKSRFLVDPHHIQLSADLRSKFKLLSADHSALHEIRNRWPGDKPASELRIHIGPLASGAAVLADSQVTAEILEQHRKLLGVDMEAYGVMAAAEEAPAPRPVPFVIKSICDFADEKKDDTSQRYAAYTSAQVLARFVENYL